MINYKIIREAVRRRVIAATGIDPLTQFQFENREFDPVGLNFWIAEYCIGGNETRLSTRHSRIASFLMQYDLFSPLNSGTDIADEMASAILAEFDLTDAEKSDVNADGYTIVVTSIKRESSSEKNWRRETLLFTLYVVTS